MMTKEEHANICTEHTRNMMNDVKVTISEKIDDLKEFINKDIKIAILEEMRNGRK
jgi:tRNA uridine 5-carbamoylmethylation protein Kti12